MKKLSLAIALTLIFLFTASSSFAIDLSNKWGATIHAGGSVLTNDPIKGYDGKTGPIVGGRILYGLTSYATLGVEVEWEKHRIEILSLDVGDVSTISLLPFFQLRASSLGAFSPYVHLGIGANFNNFDETLFLDTACILTYGSVCTLEPDDTFGLKVGVGSDYFFTKNIALNVEVTYKLNSGDIVTKVGGVPVAKDNGKASNVSFVGGITFIF